VTTGLSRQVVIIDSGGANLASLRYAFERLGVEPLVSSDPRIIGDAERVVLPGVGNAAAIMERLEASQLRDVLRRLQCPLLGICLGMQLLFESSAEGDTPGLGILPGRVEPFAASPGHPVPHMGWNTLQPRLDDPLLHGIGTDDWFYFVHGYRVPAQASGMIATTDYGECFASVVRQRNFRGVQFHPERSGSAGARLLGNFMELDACC
jgi:glutamine amidotransferase